jgi:hypothetical protein
MLLLKERRAEKRLQVNLPVTYSYAIDHDTITGNSSTHDLSDSGLSFYVDIPLKKDSNLKVDLNHIWDAPKDSRVKWCIKQHNQYKVGISF